MPPPQEDGDEPLDPAFCIVFPGPLPQNVPGGAPGVEVIQLVENGAQLADFEWFGGRADGQTTAPQGHRVRRGGDHVAAIMAKSAALFIQNDQIQKTFADLDAAVPEWVKRDWRWDEIVKSCGRFR
ncbi:MAG: hypothetical protein ACO3JG_10880 [Luteolibacter sp.]